MTMTDVRPDPDTATMTAGGAQRVYAIALDMDTNALKEAWEGDNWRYAYTQIRDFLSDYGFTWKQGSLQFSSAAVTPVEVVLAVQEMTKRFAWFAPSVRDIRMLRIEEDNDLKPAVASIAPLKPHPVPEILDLSTAMDQDY